MATANSLSLNEVRDVLNGHQVLGDKKEIQEVKKAYAAYEKIPEIDPSSMSSLKNIHGIMTHLTVEESGEYRKGEEGKRLAEAMDRKIKGVVRNERFSNLPFSTYSDHPVCSTIKGGFF